MDPDQLLFVARLLADPSGNPTEERLRRSVSTAYYALFHTLSNACADLLVGETPADRTSDEWHQAYRTLDHGQVRRQCGRSEVSRYSIGIRQFAVAFREIQDYRHDADYSPRAAFVQDQVSAIINRAASAISDFVTAPEDERRRFIVYLALRRR